MCLVLINIPIPILFRLERHYKRMLFPLLPTRNIISPLRNPLKSEKGRTHVEPFPCLFGTVLFPTCYGDVWLTLRVETARLECEERGGDEMSFGRGGGGFVFEGYDVSDDTH